MLTTVLTLAFFGSVVTESANSRSVSGGVSARQLAQAAVQMVEGTITQATVPSDPTGTAIAWASQPGMIRTYGSGSPGNYTASSTPLNYYKLYSSSTMVVTNPNGTFAPDGDINQNWQNLPAQYTDLNAPGSDSSGHLIFPIVDPRAMEAQYAVEGFSYTTSTSPNNTPVPGVNTNAGTELLPMPVQWIYVLRDGSTLTPTSATGNTATFPSSTSTVPIPGQVSPGNPIVGRIAYWTDDECAKVNLNTASEGTYWDTPIADSGSIGDTSFNTNPLVPMGDVIFAINPPAQHEYQRYPGHPATTCLSTVFGTSLGASLSRSKLVPAITSVTPRVTDLDTPSGSTSGPTDESSLGGTQTPTGYADSTKLLPLKYNRLYATIDDFNFDPSRNQQALGNATATETIIQRSRFFLTTSSKASELNLFGLPRVSIWPTWDDANKSKRSPFDNEIVSCATIANGAAPGGGPGSGYQHLMEFTRENPRNYSTDANILRNQQLYGYLQALTSRPVPGFGGTFSNKYGSVDPNGSTDINQILTEVFDYIRCTNLADQTGGVNNSYTPSVPTGSPNLMTARADEGGNIAVGQVVPIRIGTTQGFGRIATVAEFGLVLVKADDRIDPAYQENSVLPAPAYPPNTHNLAPTIKIIPGGMDAGNNAVPTPVVPSTNTILEWTLIPRIFSPSVGFVALGNDIRIHFTQINLNFKSSADNTTTSVKYNENTVPDMFDIGRICPSRDSVIGGNIGVVSLIDPGNGTLAAAPAQSMYPTGLFVVDGTNLLQNAAAAPPTLTISGNFSAQLLAPATGGQVLQTYNVTIPAATTVTLPPLVYIFTGAAPGAASAPYTWGGTYRNSTYSYPKAVAPGILNYQNLSVTDGYSGRSSSARIGNASFYYISLAGDTIRSLVPIGASGGQAIQGDMRMVTPLTTVATGAFGQAQTAAGATPASTDLTANFLRLGNVIGFQGNNYGQLLKIAGLTSKDEVPVLPGLLPPMMAGSLPADFDNGPGTILDGPYINKADEGTSLINQATSVPATLAYLGSYQTGAYTANSQYPTTTTFSPNRQLSSPVMFGSLPAGLDHPWRTLLFRPARLPGYNPISAGNTYTHPGASDATIPDHLLLDLFNMPIVEPYCISDPLATAGKINLNTQIVPFTYITRTTGLRAVLKSVMMAALNPTTKIGTNGGASFITAAKASYYGGGSAANTPQNNPGVVTRYPLNLDETVKNFTARFLNTSHTVTSSVNQPNFYVSASEVCDIPLVPNDTGTITATTTSSTSSLANFWTVNSMTGDNALEKPYSLIYPRVTTRSNVFTVHVRAQSLRKLPSTVESEGTWTEGQDIVTGEYRGSFTIEKYFDPNHAVIAKADGTVLQDSDDLNITTDAAVRGDDNDGSATGSHTLVHGALWRLVESKRFGQ